MTSAWAIPPQWSILAPARLSTCCFDQVLAASQRVAGLRSTVPAALSEHLKGTLEQCRPSTPEHAEAAAEAAEASPVTPAPGDGMTPAPAELQGKFAGATAQIPTLRCGQRQACLACQWWGVFTIPPLHARVQKSCGRKETVLSPCPGQSWRRRLRGCSASWLSWRPMRSRHPPTQWRGLPEAWPRRRLLSRRQPERGWQLRLRARPRPSSRRQ